MAYMLLLLCFFAFSLLVLLAPFCAGADYGKPQENDNIIDVLIENISFWILKIQLI